MRPRRAERLAGVLLFKGGGVGGGERIVVDIQQS
jgi:hypothetical protein